MRRVSGLLSGRQGRLLCGVGVPALLATMAASSPARAQAPAEAGPPGVNNLVRAIMRTDRPVLQAGQPVWVEFVLVNLTENRLTLRVPEVSVDATEHAEMGLPLEHVFSGRGFVGPMLMDQRGERHDSKANVKPHDKVPAIRLAPHGSVGLRLDLTQYYDSLLRPGNYKLVWQPYNGSIVSEPLAINVLAEKQAVIITDFGKITLRFFYDKAPNHVQNFIELIEQRFYDNLTFNRIIPGGVVQGGDPLGNRRGVRPDGKRVKAEFSDVPFELGTVGMCRANQDPDSASCQFFICLGRQPAFDGHQTAFAYVEGNESFETLRRLAAIPTEKQKGLEDYPRRPVYIRAISLENVAVRERPATRQPTSRPASQPAFGITTEKPGRSGAVNLVPSADVPVAADLPGLRAQGKVGPRKQPTTASAPAK